MSFAAMLTQEITVESAFGKDAYGEPGFVNKRAVPARIENKVDTYIDDMGVERMSDQVIATTERISIKDRIWLPGTNSALNEEARHPKRIANAQTPSGSYTVFMTYL